MKRRIAVFSGLALSWLAAPAAVLAQGSSGASGEGLNVSLVLAPLAAAALGIERLLEAIWGIVEMILSYMKVDTDAPKYVEFKTWAAAALGIIIGLIIAGAAELRMFAMLNLPANPGLDVFVTGLVIGSGSKFTHDVIGIFFHGKKGLEEWGKLLKVKRTANEG
ncbi:MAG: hypothetical protein ACE5G8_09590 [Anaerolineae bacterium]